MAEPSYYDWVDPAEGEEVHTPIKDKIAISRTWQSMGFDRQKEILASAYFDAVLDKCRNKGLVMGMDLGLVVCVPVERLLALGMEGMVTASKVHVLQTLQEFLDAIKERVDESLSDPKPEDYWDYFAHEMTDVIRSCRILDRIRVIDQHFDITGG